MDKKQSIASIEKSHPVDFILFGSMGAVSAHLSEALISGFNGRRFEFMDIGEFQVMAHSGPLSEVNRIYWKEILYRAFWGISHQRHEARKVADGMCPRV